MQGLKSTNSESNRLAELEKTVSLLRRVVFSTAISAFILVGYLLVFVSQPVSAGQSSRSKGSKLVRARAVEILGEDDQVLMRLGSDSGSPFLTMSDPDGKTRISMGLYRFSSVDFGPAMELLDRQGNSSVFLGANSASEPKLILKDRHNNSRIKLYLPHDGESRIEIYNKEGKVEWGVVK